MKCRLCGAEVGSLKKNTHYITSFLIQRCLDERGQNVRGRGSYYEIGPNIEYRFERDTSPEAIANNLQQPISDDIIERNRNNHPCSVDDYFCADCEAKFSVIESDYSNSIHSKIVQQNVYSFGSEFNAIFRSFFYLQFCRTILVKGESDNIEQSTFNILKSSILKYPNVDEVIGFYDLPISVSHLITVGEDKDYTCNCIIDDISWYCPHLLFMSDFVAQLYDDKNSLPFIGLFGINNLETYKNFILLDDSNFQIQVIDDSNRRLINERCYIFSQIIRSSISTLRSILNLPNWGAVYTRLIDVGLRNS